MSDLIHVVEATYALGMSDAQWMQDLANAARPLLDDGLGVMSVTLAPDHHGTLRARGAPICAGMTKEVSAALQSASATEDPRVLAVASSRPVNTMRHALGDRFEAVSLGWPVVKRAGIVDNFAVTACNPDGTVLCLTAPLRVPRPLTDRTVRRWSRVAAHLAAGLRLRARDPHAGSSINAAVLSPAGEVVHAEPDAKSKRDREALRNAAVLMDKARGGLRRSDPDQALAQWTSLVRGRFTLVDEFDNDGRRFVIARRNQPHAPGSSLLSSRERQVVAFRSAGHALKLIAYELGLSDSTISRVLARARHKLGARDDLELVRLVRGA